MTREEIIELINQYIYTNGFQRITAAQLNEVLIEMANSFAIEGGSSSGIDAVLATGSTVSENREITNEDGGTLRLAAEMAIEGDTIKYIGMNFQDDLTEGNASIGKGMSFFGNRLLSVDKGDANAKLDSRNPIIIEALTIHKLASSPPNPEEEAGSTESGSKIKVNGFTALMGDSIPEGIISFVNSNLFNSAQWIGPRGIISNVEANGDPDISSSHVQTISEFNWNIQNSFIMSTNIDGLTLAEGRKLVLTSGSEAPTSGRATLAGGSVSVATTAVKSNSVISLTVQETGTFVGNIRISAKTPDSGFVISSTQDTDTCEVFWQIIDLL